MKLITSPLTKKRTAELIQFLSEDQLTLDEQIEKIVCLIDENDRIIACGAVGFGVLKDIKVAAEHQNEGLAAILISELTHIAAMSGKTHCTLFTKPQNRRTFEALGFSTIEQTETVLLMENQPRQIQRFLASLPKFSGLNGCIVMNANPMTLGHLQLVQTAAKQCDHLYLFVVEEDRSAWPFAKRIEWVKQSTAEIKNVSVHSTGPYLISSATFPDYFLKENAPKEAIFAELDLAVFLHHFVTALSLSLRFVGSEPFDPTTAAYNRAMKKRFANTPVQLIEYPRFNLKGEALSASQVRSLLQQGKYEEAASRTPQPVSRAILAMKKEH